MNYIIGLQVAPSTKKSITTIKVSVVRLSYGGGLGGTSVLYRCTKIDTSGPLYVLKTFFG